MEALEGLLTAAQSRVSAGGWFANLAVSIVGVFMLVMKMRGIGREDQLGAEQVRSVKQAGDLVQQVLVALERSNVREEALVARVDRLGEENASLIQQLADMSVELHLVRNQLRNLAAVMRQVRDGHVAPGAVEIPEG